MESRIESLQNISTNLKFDYVIIAQDWHCERSPTGNWPSSIAWKYNKHDELCEGPNFINTLTTPPIDNCNQVCMFKFLLKYFQTTEILFLLPTFSKILSKWCTKECGL